MICFLVIRKSYLSLEKNGMPRLCERWNTDSVPNYIKDFRQTIWHEYAKTDDWIWLLLSRQKCCTEWKINIINLYISCVNKNVMWILGKIANLLLIFSYIRFEGIFPRKKQERYLQNPYKKWAWKKCGYWVWKIENYGRQSYAFMVYWPCQTENFKKPKNGMKNRRFLNYLTILGNLAP